MTVQERTPFQISQLSFGQYLMDRGVISSAQLLRANAELASCDADLGEILLSQGLLTPSSYADMAADWLGTTRLTRPHLAPDLHLLDTAGTQTCLKQAILPLSQGAGVTIVATARPERYAQAAHQFPLEWGITHPVIATEADIQQQIAQHRRPELARSAQSRTPVSESCRSWEHASRRRYAWTVVALCAVFALVLWQPIATFTALTAWAGFTMLVAGMTKLVSVLSFLFSRPPAALPVTSRPLRKRPRISVLVPLYRETEVASHLLLRLSRLAYPKSLLDVVLVLEETDTLTREAIADATLPHWVRVVVVPDGHPRTKPRAMNYALDFCRGDVIGIYDAEDAPEPDQLDKVATRFMQAPDNVVCLQGVLDYYNARQNWLARCFTIEYATWFRVMMPGLQRLGFAIPLGGTTLFFRRDVLENLGGWDAHNVTEDADLGFRLARHGYCTEMLPTTTREEANCKVVPWVKQRSRWLKGYMVTYLVHMRRPALLFRQLGAWRFIGFQAHFITALSQFFLAPLLWSMWLIVAGLYHPLVGIVSSEWISMTGVLFFGVELCMMMAALIAVSGAAHRHLLPWVPTIHFYFPLGVLAAYKALYELVLAPFYWDKTQHGLSITPSTGSRVQLQPGHESL
ncbi:glycosyltransferase [Thalassovita sp.]|uniref:glycosyltransferase n=1 Tax=Thalassovita sp. TaxID=1979401 RepID=UPI0029DE896F|nr:glycosyltransferase [Thalassovita sp.]